MKKQSCHCKMCSKECLCAQYEKLFSLLQNRNRLHILNALRKGEKSVGELQELTNMKQSAVSHALRALDKGGFVKSSVKGKFRVYSLKDRNIGSLMKKIDTTIRGVEL